MKQANSTSSKSSQKINTWKQLIIISKNYLNNFWRPVKKWEGNVKKKDKLVIPLKGFKRKEYNEFEIYQCKGREFFSGFGTYQFIVDADVDV